MIDCAFLALARKIRSRCRLYICGEILRSGEGGRPEGKKREGKKEEEKGNATLETFSVRGTGSTQLRQSHYAMRRAFTLSFITRPRASSRARARADAYIHARLHARERAPAYTYIIHTGRERTVDINNVLVDMEAVDMRSENPLTVTLSVSSLNLKYSKLLASPASGTSLR